MAAPDLIYFYFLHGLRQWEIFMLQTNMDGFFMRVFHLTNSNAYCHAVSTIAFRLFP